MHALFLTQECCVGLCFCMLPAACCVRCACAVCCVCDVLCVLCAACCVRCACALSIDRSIIDTMMWACMQHVAGCAGAFSHPNPRPWRPPLLQR